MMILTVAIATFVGYIIFKVMKHVFWVIRAKNMTSNIPGPKPIPIFGNLIFFRNVRSMEDAVEKALDLYHTHRHPVDNLMKFWFGPKLMLVLGDPHHLEKILSDEEDIKIHRDEIHDFFGLFVKGAFVKNGKEWEELRKPMNQFFTKTWIESRLTMYHDRSMELIKFIDEEVEDNVVFDVKYFVSRLSTNVFLASQAGYEWDYRNKETADLPEVIEKGLKEMFQTIFSFPFNVSLVTAIWSSSGRKLRQICKVAWAFSHEIIKARKKIRRNLSKETTSFNNFNYIDYLIEISERKKMSWNDTGSLVLDHIVGGAHSTSVMTSSAILMLAMHPEYQEAVYQEQVEIMGKDPNVAPTWEQISKMTYLDRVVKEILRIHAASVAGRKVSKDIVMGKYRIPEGSTIIFPTYATHRDARFWSHPDKFFPDHFLPEEVAKRTKFAFRPFGFGARACPGALFGKTAVKLAISTLIRKYQFKSDLKMEDLTYKFLLFIEISGGYHVRKIKRI